MFDICKMDWNEVMWMVERLANELQGKFLWGVPRGGLLVATMMTYQGCKLASDPARADVIVDDIADTGKTLTKLAGETATLIVRQGCDPVPNYWIMLLNVEDYIWFPWETEQEHINFMNTHYEGEHSE